MSRKQQIPDIGASIEVLRGGRWTSDWICQIRIDHGPNPQDAELGVLVYGSNNQRFKVGEADWRYLHA